MNLECNFKDFDFDNAYINILTHCGNMSFCFSDSRFVEG